MPLKRSLLAVLKTLVDTLRVKLDRTSTALRHALKGVCVLTDFD